MTIHRCLYIEAWGDYVRKVTIGRYTLTYTPRYGSSWIPALCLFIEEKPRQKRTLDASWDLIIVRATS